MNFIKNNPPAIEDMTMNYDEKSLYKTSPNLLNLLIRDDMPNAKEYLKRYLPQEDLHLIYHLGSYTLEAIVIYVLGLVFSCVKESSVALYFGRSNGFCCTSSSIYNEKNGGA